MNIFVKLYRRAKAFRNLEEAIRRAEAAYMRYGTRCYVIPNGERLAIIDKSTFRRVKDRDKLRGITTMADVERLCIYYTPRYNGQEPMPLAEQKKKRHQYYRSLGLNFALDF